MESDAPDLIRWIASEPRAALIELDRELVARGGFRMFVELAWPTVEGDGTFTGNWHIDEICSLLEEVSAGKERRVAIAVPPRHMKSLITAVFFPAWDWIAHPSRRFLYASYAHNLSIRDSTRCRRVIQSPWYQARWGDRYVITSDQNTKVKFENDKGGYRLSTSVGGQLTGEGGDIIVIDDAHNVIDTESPTTRETTLRWWDEAMSTRLNSPETGAYVIIQQRVNQRDLLGHELVKHPGEWTYCCLPAEFEPDHPNRWKGDPRTSVGELLWPGHMSRRVIDRLKIALGPYAAASQLQQRPAPREGGLFKRSWFPIVPTPPLDCDWSRAWDLAATEAKLVKSDPDYTATAKVGFSPSQKKYVIAHVARWREDPGKVRALIKQHADIDGRLVKQSVPQDPGQAGKDQAQQIALLLAGWQVQLEPQSGDKVTRATPLAGQAAAGNVVLVAGPWNDDFLEEMTGFPTGAHDDQVDAAASAFNRLTGGSMGMLEFYTGQAAAIKAALKPPGPGEPGIKVTEESTGDLGRAFGDFVGKRPVR